MVNPMSPPPSGSGAEGVCCHQSLLGPFLVFSPLLWVTRYRQAKRYQAGHTLFNESLVARSVLTLDVVVTTDE